jgi:hypothetical protein
MRSNHFLEPNRLGASALDVWLQLGRTVCARAVSLFDGGRSGKR